MIYGVRASGVFVQVRTAIRRSFQRIVQSANDCPDNFCVRLKRLASFLVDLKRAAPHLGRSYLGRHFTAFFCASTASFSALLAMIGLMLRTDLAAGLANFGADTTDLCGKIATTCHRRSGEATSRSTIQVSTNTICHHRRVRLT